VKLFVETATMRRPDDAARWLLEFARADLAGRETADAERSLRAFLASGYADPFAHMIASQVAGLPDASLDERDVSRLQRRLRRGLDRLRTGKPWEMPARLRYRLAPAARGFRATEPLGPIVDRFHERCAAILGAVGPKIKACEACGDFYLPRKRQRYCSDECFRVARRDYNREAQRRSRERARGKARERARKAYLDSVRRKLKLRSQAAVRIGRALTRARRDPSLPERGA
jgi:hypothetical protein